MEETQRLKGIIEALIFSSDKPLPFDQIKEVIEGVETQVIRSLIEELKTGYENSKSGLTVAEVAGGFQMCTSEEYAPYLKKFYKIKHKERLSTPSLETLAIIAYKQPLTRMEIEAVRGVNVDGVINNLLEKSLIRISGRKEAVGRPFVYSTTRQFLEYFGLKSLDELPKMEDFSKLNAALDAVQTNEPITPIEEGISDATGETSKES